jgi:glutamine amidotransferase
MRLVKARTDTAEKPSSTNFLVSDGELMVATRRNRTLHFSELRAQGARGDPPPDGEQLQQFVVASEELSGERHWHPVPEEALIGVDPALTLRTWTMDGLAR